MGGNYIVTASCGCVVTFLKEAEFKSSRLDPCKKHKEGTPQVSQERDAIVALAKRQRDLNCNHANN